MLVGLDSTCYIVFFGASTRPPNGKDPQNFRAVGSQQGGISEPTVGAGWVWMRQLFTWVFPKLVAPKIMISMNKKHVSKLGISMKTQSLFSTFSAYIDYFPTTFFFALSCLIAEVQPDFQSYLIIQIVGIHRSSPLVIGGMMIKYGRDIKSQRILTGNRSIDEVSTII